MVGVEYALYAKFSDEVVEEHFRRIKNAGIDVVWIFCDDLDDFARVLPIARRVGLSVIPTITFIGLDPTEFLEKHPEEITVLSPAGGKQETGQLTALMPQVRPSPCYNSPIYQGTYNDLATEFLRRFGDEDAFYRHNGQPVVEFVREAWYRTGRRELGVFTTPNCYCHNCVETYRADLRKRFEDTGRLNKALGTHFSSWDEVVPPADAANRVFWKDWLDFHAAIIPGFLASAIEAARSVKPDIQTTHELNDWYPIWWDTVLTGNDYYRMAKALDICFEDMYPLEHHHVHAIYLYELTKEIARAAGDFSKPVWANAQALVGWIDFYPPPEGWEIEQVYSAVAHGATGIAWWHDFHDPSTEGREDCKRYGGLPDALLEATKDANAEVKRLWKAIEGFQRNDSQVALLYSWTTMELEMNDDHPYDLVQIYSALVRSNYPVDVLSERQVTQGLLGEREYRVLFAPACSSLPEAVRDAIVTFVEQGGTLVQDYSTSNPAPYTSLFDDRVNDKPTTGRAYTIIGDTLAPRGASHDVSAKAEALTPKDGDQILAVYDDGKPAILSFRLGKGTVVRFGSLIGIDYAGWQPGVFEFKEPRFPTTIRRDEGLRKLVDTLVKRGGVTPPAETDNADVEVVSLQKGDELKLLVINHRYAEAAARVRVPIADNAYTLVDVRAGQEIPAEVIDGYLHFELHLARLDGREIQALPAS